MHNQALTLPYAKVAYNKPISPFSAFSSVFLVCHTKTLILVDVLTWSQSIFDQWDQISEGNVIKNDILNAKKPWQRGGFSTQCEVVSS